VALGGISPLEPIALNQAALGQDRDSLIIFQALVEKIILALEQASKLIK
jgi:hypothetical protein